MLPPVASDPSSRTTSRSVAVAGSAMCDGAQARCQVPTRISRRIRLRASLRAKKNSGAGRGQGRKESKGLGTSNAIGDADFPGCADRCARTTEAVSSCCCSGRSSGRRRAGAPVQPLSAAAPFAGGEELGKAWHGLIGTGDHELQESLVEQTLKEPTRSSCDASWRQWAMARIVSSSGRLRSCFWRSQSGSLPPRLEF